VTLQPAVAGEAPPHPSSVQFSPRITGTAEREIAPVHPVADAGTATRRNRWIAIAVTVAMFVASAFPPFQWTHSDNVRNLGYSFLLLPPQYSTSPVFIGSVNFGILVLEYVAILSAGVLAWLVAPWMRPLPSSATSVNGPPLASVNITKRTLVKLASVIAASCAFVATGVVAIYPMDFIPHSKYDGLVVTSLVWAILPLSAGIGMVAHRFVKRLMTRFLTTQ
jgi:hypothetical protein